MISLCLQCCPLDLTPTGELVELICDLEPRRRDMSEFFLLYRKDCPPQLVKAFEERAARKFVRYRARMARNHAVGWAEGPNALAMSAFMEMMILRREGICQNEAFLLFEPDCVPMVPNWLELLSSEWERAKGLGKEAVGHWHQAGADTTTLHMNGNAVFRSDFYERHPNMHGGPGTQGWDFWHREKYIALSCDTAYIYQWYGAHSISCEQLAGIEKNGVRPALFHGVKDGSARACIRKAFL